MVTAIDVLKTKKVDQVVLKKEFINYFPDRLDYVIAIEKSSDRKLMDLANQLDYIDYHYRRYLKGHAKTLRRVFDEFKNLETKYLFEGLIIIDEIAQLAEDNEFFELLTRHNKARQKICDKFKINE